MIGHFETPTVPVVAESAIDEVNTSIISINEAIKSKS
ncbi:predicted protein [Botrytis cinerea T4]|uniref:Uncharacterized protein n=1 Tax=Botryotinia fuckeliana (strain T4) TaxID=999810 RepID=G2YGA5_BOTF4|nr:predicted protein [Botrytis cinerea T4]